MGSVKWIRDRDVGGGFGGGFGGDVGGDIITNNDAYMSESHDLMNQSLEDPVWVPFEPPNQIWVPEQQITAGLVVPTNVADFFM